MDENNAAETLALQALAWTVGQPDRAERFLSVTGLDPADLRRGVTDRPVLAATLGFLADHEPDLLSCAADLGTTPAALVAAREVLA